MDILLFPSSDELHELNSKTILIRIMQQIFLNIEF